MDRWGVVRLVDQHWQLVVRQRNILHCRGRRVLPSVSSVGIRGLKRKENKLCFGKRVGLTSGGGGKWMMGGFSPE